MTRLRSTTRPRPGESGETPVAHAGFTTGELADRLGATLVGPRDLHVVRVDARGQGDARTITFIREQKFAEAYAEWIRDLRARAYVELREPPS